MEKNLPSRPNLDHLRRQAKTLLASLEAGDEDAVAVLQSYLPAAKGMSEARVRAAGFRLADAQSAVARKSGFSAWPQLARHVEQLRSLEGTWLFARLEIDGADVPIDRMASSRLLIDGDRFRMESPDATYEGIFNIDVEAQPHRIDIEFVEGPEAGKWNYGIFRVDGDELEICLDMGGKARPAEFGTSPGSERACETLRRMSGARPAAVTGGNPQTILALPDGADARGFEFVQSPTLARLQGEWIAEQIIVNGKALPPMMLKTGRRVAKGNELKVTVGGSVVVHALVRIDERTQPVEVDYHVLSGASKGHLQQGIMEWRDGSACFCMAAPGQERPGGFECPAGSGWTLSVWRAVR